MTQHKKIAFLFPGQGSQYPGMGRDFVDSFPQARLVFEEADDILKRKISTLILEGPETELTQTKNSQVAIFVTSIALLRVVQHLFPAIKPAFCSGLSLGEYTALVSAEIISFQECLSLVQYRAECMNDACEATRGTMAAILGLDGDAIAEVVTKVNLPNDLWVANYNCPGQTVISGTIKGIEAGTTAILAAGAKRVIPLQVHGAFHSGLMQLAENRLADPIHRAPLVKGSAEMVMNVPGDVVSDLAVMRECLIKQVTRSVRWEQGIRAMQQKGVDFFIEFGPGKTLSPMNKRIGVVAPTLSIEKIEDLNKLETV